MHADLPLSGIDPDAHRLTLDTRRVEHDDPRVVTCIRGLTAFVDSAALRHGPATAITSLIAVAADLALLYGDPGAALSALRRTADGLEMRMRTAAGGSQ